MDRPGHLRRLTPLALALAVGCSYAEARIRDLGDIVRLEGKVGYGLEAHANAGELAHAGLGSAREWSAGWTYGRGRSQTAEQHHLPVTLVRTLLTPEASHLHSTDLGPDGEDGRHECYLLFPGGINPGGLEKTRPHFLDVEVGILAGVVGVEAGVSLGEAFDFVLGLFRFSDQWTFLDLGDDDDPERRADKRIWQRVNRHEGPAEP
jgi:hypothetical protein